MSHHVTIGIHTAEEMENITTRLMLGRSFTSGELEFLHRNAHFQQGVAEMRTMEAYHRTIALGERLLMERGSAIAIRLPQPPGELRLA